MVRLNPSTVLIEDHVHQIKRTSFEIDQQRGQAILNRTPRATSNRFLSQSVEALTLDEQKKFRDTGNNALVRILNINYNIPQQKYLKF